jgi:class 3 adenylate cyclase/tetratricopeptide (TPR) repeat protein
MRCAVCGTDNEPGRKFCGECGSALAVVCPNCGTPNNPGSKFCGECGTAFTGVAASAARAAAPGPPVATAPAEAAVAERRLVTVLFADLVGFTPFAEGRDAEEVRDTLSRYFDLARGVVERYGGTVEKFIGDAVMAVWGTPTAHEDDAERAVRAALDLTEAVRSLGEGIQARAGVLTGEAAVTLGAVGEGMVAGDLVNTASRLQSAAATGAVLVGESTMRAASSAIAFEPAGEQALKGKASPIPAWRAVRIVAERGGRGRAETLEAPFVGRDDELRQLKDQFHATSRDKRVRLVSVTGVGGIGKSRLAWEFLKYIDGLVEPVYWHAGRSPSYGSGLTFWALGEMIRSRVGLSETDDETTTRAKVAEATAQWVPDLEERRWIEPALLTLLGIEAVGAAGAGGSREQLFAAWRTFFERVAADGTVVMVFEDLQWADSGVLDFLDHLVKWSRGAPIYVITLARPELLDARPDWGAGMRNFVAIGLEPLAPSAMRELLAGLVPGLPEPAVRAIVARAEGIPLYAVETVRMLVAEGKLIAEEGTYRPVGDLSTLAVPETLHALVAARLDALEREDRALVQDASVLGQTFTLAAVVAVSGRSPDEVEPRLRTLVRREILVLDVDSRSPERGQYGFVQALLRDVAYSTLAHKDRKQRHLAAARYFESIGGDELAGALASQYLDAYRNAGEGPEAEALAAQARIALVAAAERAVALGSLDQAVTFYDQSRELTAEPAAKAGLLVASGGLAVEAGRGELAEERLREAIALLRAGDDPSALAFAYAELGRALIGTFRYDAAVEELESATKELVAAGAVPDDAGRVTLLGQLSRAHFFRDENSRAVEVADRALEAGEHVDLVTVVADVLITRGSALSKLGRAYEGRADIIGGIGLAEERDLAATALRGRINLGVYLADTDPHAALEVAQAALVVGSRLGRRGMLRTIVGNAAAAAQETGDWEWAIQQIDAILETETDVVGRNYMAWARWSMRTLQGDASAEEHVELIRWAESLDDESAHDAVEQLLAERAFAEGRFEEAADRWLTYASAVVLNSFATAVYSGIGALLDRDADRASAALAVAEAGVPRGRLPESDRRLLRAGIQALRGQVDEGSRGLREALAVYADMRLPWRQALAALVLVAVLGPERPEVGAAADEARAILTGLKARPFLAHLDRFLERQPEAPEPSVRRGRAATADAATEATRTAG